MSESSTRAAADPESPPRFHHLDGLRTVAMLLGIVLHGLMSFIEIPVWPAQDLHQHSTAFGWVLHAIHGFRMPLFFLISGFFTAMLWRRRSLAALIKHRAVRILLPLLIGLVITWPLMIGLGIWGGFTKARLAERHSGASETGGPTIWAAAKDGDLEALNRALEAGADVNFRDGMGITPLGWASLMGRTEAMALLIGRGADVNAVNRDGSTPLHAAAFLGRTAAAELLLESGARTNLRNHKRETPLDSASHDWGTVQWIAGMLRIEVDRAEFDEGRKATIALLRERAGIPSPSEEEAGNETGKRLDAVIGIWTFGAMMPFFHHLWFLYYLCLFVAVFAVAAPVASRLPVRLSEKLAGPRIRWFWLLPLTLAAQIFMRQSFGPDTATGLLPWPPKFLYYGTFFGFGALVYGLKSFEDESGKRWPLCFLLAVPALLGGLHFFERRGGEPFEIDHLLTSLLAVIYAWLMIFGCLGFFRRFFSPENPRIRYLSDSAYWLYLAHLPLVMGLQILVSGWPFPGYAKFLGILTVTTGLLLLSYEYGIRYTWIGAILNGRKKRPADR